MSENKFNEIVQKKLNQFPSEIRITISALTPSKRKGFDMISKFLEQLKILAEERRQLINLNIITSKYLNIGDSSEFLQIHQQTLLNKIEFERTLANSHLFLSFSRVDSVPYTINMCYFVNVMIGAFNVGVAVDLAKISKSVLIAKEINSESMLTVVKNIIGMDSSEYSTLVKYDPIDIWK